MAFPRNSGPVPPPIVGTGVPSLAIRSLENCFTRLKTLVCVKVCGWVGWGGEDLPGARTAESASCGCPRGCARTRRSAPCQGITSERAAWPQLNRQISQTHDERGRCSHINTPLQWGVLPSAWSSNRFRGFRRAVKTAEAVRAVLPLRVTPLKWGVNETGPPRRPKFVKCPG